MCKEENGNKKIIENRYEWCEKLMNTEPVNTFGDIQRNHTWDEPAAAAAKSIQSRPTLCNPRDGSPPGSPIPGILQARTLEWVAISFSNAWKWKVKVKSLSRVRLFATPWIAAYQAPPSMGFSRQEYWSGVPLPSLEMNLGNFKDFLVFWKKEEDTDINVGFIKPLCKEVGDKKQEDTCFIILWN